MRCARWYRGWWWRRNESRPDTSGPIAAVANAFDLGIALLAPNADSWEIQYCAALAVTLKGEDTRIISRIDFEKNEMKVSEAAGIGIDWSLEPSFSKIQWQS